MNTGTSGSRYVEIPQTPNSQVTGFDSDFYFRLLYSYHQKFGYKCMQTTKICSLLSSLFGLAFSMFLLSCISWEDIFLHNVNTLKGALRQTCKPDSDYMTFVYAFFIIGWFIQAGHVISFLSQASDVHELWRQKLELPEDVKWISWTEVMDQYASNVDIRATRDYIVSRIMRYDNYLIAMLNKNIFGFDSGRLFSKTIELNLWLAFKVAFFTSNSGLHVDFLLPANHTVYTRRLKYIFIGLGILNAVVAPFILLGCIVYFLYRYVSIYHKDPHKIGIYQFTPLAKWKLRDFNELPHVYLERLNRAHKTVEEYLSEFADERYNGVYRLLEFITGSVLAVLVWVSFMDQTLLVSFTLYGDQHILFFMGVFGAIFMGCQSAIRKDAPVSDPDERFNDLIQVLHYTPLSWNRLSTKARYIEIQKLFRYRITIFFHEVMSLLYSPFIFMFWLPRRADKIVKFLRDNSSYIPDRGVVCTYSLLSRTTATSETGGDGVCVGNGRPRSLGVFDALSDSTETGIDQSLNLKWNHSIANFQQYYQQSTARSPADSTIASERPTHHESRSNLRFPINHNVLHRERPIPRHTDDSHLVSQSIQPYDVSVHPTFQDFDQPESNL